MGGREEGLGSAGQRAGLAGQRGWVGWAEELGGSGGGRGLGSWLAEGSGAVVVEFEFRARTPIRKRFRLHSEAKSKTRSILFD